MDAVKVCGLTRVADAVLAADLGASAIGCVFWDKSPRFVVPSVAARIRASLPSHVGMVGVFVNASRAWIEEVRSEVGLNGVQLHGDETQEFCESLSGDVIRAVTLENENDLKQMRDSIHIGRKILSQNKLEKHAEYYTHMTLQKSDLV